MKKIQVFLLLLIVNCTLFINVANAQWWVRGGNLSWPYGTVSMKKFIVSDDLYDATSLMADQGNNITGLFYKTIQNWQPALRAETYMSSNFTGSTQILSAYIGNDLVMSSGQQNVEVIGADFYNKNRTSGTFKWTTNTNANLVISASGTYISYAPKGKIQWGIGVRSFFSSETGAADTVLRWAGFRSMLNPYSPGNSKIENAYSFYSSNQKPSFVYGKFYHFYGEGDYNSYFGGSITQKVYTTNVSNPPTAAELNAAFPNAVDGETLYIDDNNANTNFYQVVKKGTSWWIFTGTKAL